MEYIWPEDKRFIWPQTPNDPRWMWPADPTLDPKWRTPENMTCLPPPLPQRWPNDPIVPNQTINNTLPPPAPNTTNLTNSPFNYSNFTLPNGSFPNTSQPPLGKEFMDPYGNISRFSLPNYSNPAVPRPGFTFPDPNHLIVPPYAFPPFPINPEDIPRVYKGIPNQPFGLIPPLAIPVWAKLNPNTYVLDPRPPPPAPPGTMWIPYFYYPLPHRGENSGKIGVVPQYVLVPIGTPIPTVQPVAIPVLIVPPPGIVIPVDPQNPNRPALVLYPMPVLFKPVDPNLKIDYKKLDDEKRANEARADKNKDIDKANDKNPPSPPLPNGTNTTQPNQTNPNQPGPNNTNPPGPNNTNPPGPNNTNPPNPPANNTTNATNSPPVLLPNGTVVIPPSTPNGTIIYDETGKPVKEYLGTDTVCDDWRIGVLVNRHFKNEYQWKYSDYELDKDGQYRYCARYRQIPRFKDFDQDTINKLLNKTGQNGANGPNGANGTNGQNGANGPNGQNGTGNNGGPAAHDNGAHKDVIPPSVNANKIRIEVPCENQVNVVLNDRNLELDRETKDGLGRKCSIWVNSKVEAEDYKAHQKAIADQMATGTVKQLAFLRMAPIRFDG